jgi:L,D-transpeptidase YcbB
MRVITGFLTFCALSAALAATPARALEPDPPTQLITPQEAMAIAIRRRLDDIPQQLDKAAANERRALAQFYAQEGSRPIWVTEVGTTDQARRALAEIAQAEQWGLKADDFDLPSEAELARTNISIQQLIEAEFKISLAIVKYARIASGGRYDPHDLSDDIDRKPEIPAPKDVIAAVAAAADPAETLRNYHPPHEQFKRLRLAYLKALEDEANTHSVENESKSSGSRSGKRRKRPREKLSDRLLYNLDMWRWMPRELGSTHIFTNIPEFEFRMVDDGQVIHRERVITGTAKNQTPVFSHQMSLIVLNPDWNIPNSLKIRDLLPGLVQGRNVIAQKGYVLEDFRGRRLDPVAIDWYENDIRNFRVFQPPGRNNALGLVKFMFPNKHAVYMHDTPAKELFSRQSRTFSHGCVRVRNPMEFAALLLERDKGWSKDRINAIVAGGALTEITLDNKVPVHLAYFTAWVDDSGETKLFPDVYGYEKLVKMGLEGKAHLVVKPKKNLSKDIQEIIASEPRRRERESTVWYSSQGSSGYDSRNPPRWMRRVWGHD